MGCESGSWRRNTREGGLPNQRQEMSGNARDCQEASQTQFLPFLLCFCNYDELWSIFY